MVLALWDRAPAGRLNGAVTDTGGWGGIALAHGDALTRGGGRGARPRPKAAGGTIGRPGAPTEWGGYSGIFLDPDRPSVGSRAQPHLGARAGRHGAPALTRGVADVMHPGRLFTPVRTHYHCEGKLFSAIDTCVDRGPRHTERTSAHEGNAGYMPRSTPVGSPRPPGPWRRRTCPRLPAPHRLPARLLDGAPRQATSSCSPSRTTARASGCPRSPKRPGAIVWPHEPACGSSAVRTMDVVGALEHRSGARGSGGCARRGWARWARPNLGRAPGAVPLEAVPDQLRTGGFCASYWLTRPGQPAPPSG